MIEVKVQLLTLIVIFIVGFAIGRSAGSNKSKCHHKRKYPMYSGYYCPDCYKLLKGKVLVLPSDAPVTIHQLNKGNITGWPIINPDAEGKGVWDMPKED